MHDLTHQSQRTPHTFLQEQKSAEHTRLVEAWKEDETKKQMAADEEERKYEEACARGERPQLKCNRLAIHPHVCGAWRKSENQSTGHGHLTVSGLHTAQKTIPLCRAHTHYARAFLWYLAAPIARTPY